MTSISVKLLTSIVGVLAVVSAFLLGLNGQVASPINTVFGAVPTLDGVDSPYIKIGGLAGWWGTRSMSASSTNICVLKNPLGVPAVIEEVTFNMTSNRLGAVGFDVSTSTDGFATSSVIIGRGLIAAAGTADRYAWTSKSSTSTTSASPAALSGGGNMLLENGVYENGSTRFVLGSSEYINIKLSTTTGGGATIGSGLYNVGTCGFVLRAF